MDINRSHFGITVILLVSFISSTMSAFNMSLQRIESDRIRRLRLGLKPEPKVHPAVLVKHGVKVRNYYDIAYTGMVYLGSQNVSMRVILDTGSADFWVPDVSCQKCNYYCHGLPKKFAEILCLSGCMTVINNFNGSGCPLKKTFDAAESKTYSVGEGVWSIVYGTGKCGGYRGIDQVDLGGMRIKVTFGQTTQMSPFLLKDKRFDGILGLAFQSISAIGTAPPFLAAVQQKIINDAIFTVFLRRDVYDESGDGGLFTFGDVDKVNCRPNINYVPLSSATYFQFEIQSFKFDQTTLTKRRTQVISDTGTSNIFVSSAVLKEVVRMLGAKKDEHGNYVVDCGSHPNITFVINGIEYPVTSDNYLIKFGPYQCILMLDALADGEELWILGDPFIRQYCQIYDMARKRIGFADAIQS